MSKIDVAGLKIDSISKQELLERVSDRIKNNQRTFVTTPYSEFLYRGLQDNTLLDILNKADFAVPDGIGIFWARKYLEIPLTAKSFFGKIIQGLWQIIYSNAAILFNRRWIMSAFPEKIPGSNLVWDIAKLAAENNLSLYLLGGFGDTPKIVAADLEKKIIAQKSNASYLSGRENRSHELKPLIAGYSNKGPNDKIVPAEIAAAKPDILMVAYGPIVQEKWILENMAKLPAKLFIGLGGTFDYIAGKRLAPPKFIRTVGLEWLYRLVTQPHRLKRIWQATFGLITYLLRFKVYMSYPYRKNVVSIILNSKNEVLLCRRNPDDPDNKLYGMEKKYLANYWQFSQGGIEENEGVAEAAQRESFEELGLKNLRLLKISEKKHFYHYPNQKRKLLARQGNLKKGQEQSIVYFKVSEPDNSVKVDGTEFLEFKWVPLPNLVNEVHKHRQAVAKIVQEDLKDLA